jgi:hypothetical protein
MSDPDGGAGAILASLKLDLSVFMLRYGKRPPRNSPLGGRLHNYLRRVDADPELKSLVANLRQCHQTSLSKIDKAKRSLKKGRVPYKLVSGRFISNQKAVLKRPASTVKRPATRKAGESPVWARKRQASNSMTGGSAASTRKRPAAVASMKGNVQVGDFSLQPLPKPLPARCLKVAGSQADTAFGCPLLSQPVADYLYIVLHDFGRVMQIEFPQLDWVVDFGTLLAVVREKGRGIIAHDFDVDVAVLIKESEKQFFTNVIAPKLIMHFTGLGHRAHFLISPVGLPAIKVFSCDHIRVCRYGNCITAQRIGQRHRAFDNRAYIA